MFVKSTRFKQVCQLLLSLIVFVPDRALETLVKQHAEMTLFVKQVADKQQFPVFL